MVIRRERRRRDDGRERVALEALDQTDRRGTRAVPVHEQKAGVTAQDDRLDLLRVVEHEQREGVAGGPLAHQLGHR